MKSANMLNRRGFILGVGTVGIGTLAGGMRLCGENSPSQLIFTSLPDPLAKCNLIWDTSAFGYQVDEYLVSGSGTTFALMDATEAGKIDRVDKTMPWGQRDTAYAANLPADFSPRPQTGTGSYTTRIIVYRPKEADVNRVFFRDYGIVNGDNAIYFSDRNTLAVEEDNGARFLLGDKFEHRSRTNKADLARNLQSVKDARRMAGWVIYSIHSHEGGKTMLIGEDTPCDHTQALAHEVIDAGADVFVCHGAHRIRGIEIYKGKPIFYSPGNLIVENDTVLLEPQDALAVQGLGPENTAADSYDERLTSGQHATTGPGWRAFIPIVSFKNNKLHDIKIYPIELGAGLPRYEGGRPMLAQGKNAAEILDHVQRLSEPFHTAMEIQGDIGVIQVG